MAVSFVTNALGANNSTTSFSVTLPATQAGDIIILEYVHRGTPDGTIGGTYSGPAFSEKHEQLFATSTFTGRTLWSRATGDHAGQTVTGTGLTNSCAAIVTIYRGAKSSGDPLAAATIVGEPNASGNETQAEITTTVNGAWVVLVVVNSPDVAVTSQACTSPGSLSARAELLSTGGTDTAIAHASAEKATAGATGAFTWAQTDGVGGSWAYAIEPEPVAAYIDAPKLVAAPQRTDAPEFVGCAAVFMACAALFSAPDPIGAAEYTVGTHQAAVASQNRSWIKGTNPALMPAEPFVQGVTTVSAPQQFDQRDSVIFGYTPTTSNELAGTATLSFTPTAAFTALVAGTSALSFTPAGALTGDGALAGSAALTFTPTAALTGDGALAGSTALTFTPAGAFAGAADPIGAAEYTVGTHRAAYAANNGYSVKFGRYVVPAVVADTPKPGTRIAAPQAVESGYAQVSGYTPPDVVTVYSYFEVEQEYAEQRAPIIFGYTPTLSNALAGTASLSFTPTAAFTALVAGTTSISFTPTAALTGSAALTFTPNASLTGAGALLGSAAWTFTPVGAFTGSAALIGVAAWTFTPTATLTGAGALSGTAGINFTPTGALTGSGALVGASSITFSPVATLQGAGALAGSTALSFAVAGNLADYSAGQTTGTVSLTFGASALFTGGMAGTASVQFTPAATLQGAGELSGTTSLSFAPAAVFSAEGALDGDTSLSFSLTGVLVDGTVNIIGSTATVTQVRGYSATMTQVLGNSSTVENVLGKQGTID
jgi:hypothetical protein